jgi:outer membrane protein OmpA-like peptidoglycan-associated protein
MHSDPFLAPGMGSGKSRSSAEDIFVRSKNGGLGRRAPPSESPEPMDIPVAEAAPEPERKKASVVLRNPKWEVDKVGFNEETQVSVGLELPPEHAHKTKVAFELFAKTPKGPERIGQGEGKAEGGKAIGTVPVYIPTYKDEDGNRMQKAEYYFTAKHSESDLLDGSQAVKLVDEMADRLIKSHILQDVTFGFDKSFLHPDQAPALKAMCDAIAKWREEYPDGKLAVFGHADAVGKEDYNKVLAERRAQSVLAFLLKEPQGWEDLWTSEKWGLGPIQDLLRHLGHDPGATDGKNGPKTRAAVKSFQGANGLGEDGEAGPETRKALFQALIDEANTAPALKKKDFDDINGEAGAGCSEFNLIEKTQGACAANRRVAVFLLKSNKNFPIQYPCKKGDAGTCKKQVARKGDRRTAGFGCFFYDSLVVETAGSGEEIQGTVRVGLPIPADQIDADACRIKISVDGKDCQDLALADCERGEDGLAYICITDPKLGELFTVSVRHGEGGEQVAIRDFEFHKYLIRLQAGSGDFERPEAVRPEVEWAGEDDADGDTVNADPYEIDDTRLASLRQAPNGNFA